MAVRGLTEEEFKETMTDLMIQLEADLTADASAAMPQREATFWTHSLGNWHVITEYYRLLDETLGVRSETNL